MKKLGTLLASVGTLLFSACDLIPQPDYVADMLMPLVKTQIEVEDISDLSEKEFVQTVTLPNVSHIFNPVLAVPAFSNQSLLVPLPLIDDTDSYVRAKVDTAEFDLTIVNNFPINIKAGTRVVIRNATSNSDIVFEATVPEDIAPNGGRKTITLFLSSTSPWIDNDLNLYLENFGSSGSATPVSFSGANIELRFKIKIFHINEIEIPQGKQYRLRDTVDFQLYDEDNTGNLGEGKLTLFIQNGFPASYNFQGYFLSATGQVVDSLLLDTVIPSPEIDANGYVIQSSVQERRLVTEWNPAKLERLRNEAKFLDIRVALNTPTPASLPPGAPVKLRHENQVPLQLVGDLKVEVTP